MSSTQMLVGAIVVLVVVLAVYVVWARSPAMSDPAPRGRPAGSRRRALAALACCSTT
ncbi:hypothetical protein [uncultured Nocardioides sp.]|uniref:hypothetical protein n=1 Tax=uncultured Nocardioides sp. TaxID=198441 RepID=UPI00261BB71F|nr:hypothetical protein [uncultured Nocardioides sp.]